MIRTDRNAPANGNGGNAQSDGGNAPVTLGVVDPAIDSVVSLAVAVLTTPDPVDKCDGAKLAATAIRDQTVPLTRKCDVPPPAFPARPDRPQIRDAKDMPKRRASGDAGRAALLHAIAHIELNAIDLAFDMIARFLPQIEKMHLNGTQFALDWGQVGIEEANHFSLICDRLADFDMVYGDLPAHDGLWDAASNTTQSLGARLVVAPLILEARGLDVTPAMIEKLEKAGDLASAGTLKVIYEEEIGHVATGARWFHNFCISENLDPEPTFHALQREFFPAGPKPPFNFGARKAAGLPEAYYFPQAKKSSGKMSTV